MKKLVLYFLCLAPIRLLSQINVYNRSLTDSTLAILYIGAENEIRIAGNNYNSAETVVSVSGAGSQLHKTGEGDYITRVSGVGTCIFILSKGGKTIYKKEFTTALIPDAVATLAGKKDTVMRLYRVLASPFLSVTFPGCFYKHTFSIVSFRAYFIRAGDTSVTYSPSHMFTAGQTAIVKQLRPGDQLWFDDIRATCADCRIRKLPAFGIKIE
ncbi:MAG: hypothetical protein ABW019_13845 [Chitinophagaceae bacterium]